MDLGKVERRYLSGDKELLKKWDYDKNVDVDTNKISVGSNKKFFWICEKGHSYQSSVKSQHNGHGCPICAGKIVLVGYNDLFSQARQLCEEWDYDENDKSPQEYTVKSGKSVYWKCKYCGKSWKSTIHNRVVHNTKCPSCSSSRQTSFPQQAIYYYLKRYYPQTQNRVKLVNKYTLDIYVEEKNIAIEYNGYAWHNSSKSRERDLFKIEYCKKKGIYLIQIKEQKDTMSLEFQDNVIKYCRDKDDIELNNLITFLLIKIFLIENVDVNVNRDKLLIYKNYNADVKKRSLLTVNPNLAKEWDYNKNYPIKPEFISYMSNDDVWWICSKGHSFKMSVDKRMQGRNCPYCSSRKLLKGFNDLQTWCLRESREYLLKEWDYNRNAMLPEDYFRGSKLKVYWHCPVCGMTWEASILSRVKGYNNCPYCSKRV